MTSYWIHVAPLFLAASLAAQNIVPNNNRTPAGRSGNNRVIDPPGPTSPTAIHGQSERLNDNTGEKFQWEIVNAATSPSTPSCRPSTRRGRQNPGHEPRPPRPGDNRRAVQTLIFTG